jgi:hypothetical protein
MHNLYLRERLSEVSTERSRWPCGAMSAKRWRPGFETSDQRSRATQAANSPPLRVGRTTAMQPE